MSVYVGIDVHRKRSQVAVVTEDGQVQSRPSLDRRVIRAPQVLAVSGDRNTSCRPNPVIEPHRIATPLRPSDSR